MIDLGIVKPGTTLYIPFATYDSNDPSASVTLTGLATTDIEVYKNGSTTQRGSDNGYALLDTDGIDFDGVTGIHGFSIDLAENTTAGFWEAGAQYWVVVSSITVDAGTVNFIAATFRIGYPNAVLNTSIASLSSQTSFTLTAGPAEDDALNGMWAVIHDVASAVQFAKVLILDYTGSTKTVTLAAGATFTAAATDNISIIDLAPLQPTTTGRTLDVSTGGEAGLDWANVGSPTTSLALTGTTIASTQKVDIETIKTQAVTCAAGVTVPATIASTTNITAGTITTVTNLTNAATSGDFTATMKTSIGTAVAASAVASVTGNVGGNVVGSVGSVTAGVTLGDTAHGGTSATLRLGGSTSTPALYVTNSGGDAAKFESTGGNGNAVTTLGHNTGAGLSTTGGVSGNGMVITGVGGLIIDGGTGDGVNIQGSAKTVNILGELYVVTNEIPWNAAWDAEVQSECADALTAYDPPTNTEMEARTILAADYATATNLATVDTVVDAIKAKTDSLPASPAATGDAMTLTSGERDSVAAALLDLADAVETGITPRGTLRLMLASLAGKLSGAATATVTIRNVGDSKDRITATVDADGNRTAVTTDAT